MLPGAAEPMTGLTQVPEGLIGAIAFVIVGGFTLLGRVLSARDEKALSSPLNKPSALEALTDTAVELAQQATKERLAAIQERNDALEREASAQERAVALRRELYRWRNRFDAAVAYIDLLVAIIRRDVPGLSIPPRPEELDEGSPL